MKKIPAAHGTDFTLRKEAGKGNMTEPFLNAAAVVMRPAEQPFSPPATAEQKRAERRAMMSGPVGGEKKM